MLYLDISNQELEERILLLRDRERAITVKFLNHLGEFDKRRLYLDLGYSSLFDYCVRKLGYSESSAFRRVECARALREFPQLGPMILNGEVNLCSLATAARKLSEGRIGLADINGKSRREVEGLVAGLNPGHKPKEKIRQISVMVASEPMVNEFQKGLSAPNSPSTTETPLNPSPELISENSLSPVKVKCDAVAEGVFSPINSQREGARLLSPVKVKSETRLETRSETRIEIKFSLSEESFKKLEEVKAALSNKLGAGASVEDIFNELMERYLKTARPVQRSQGEAEGPARAAGRIHEVAAALGECHLGHKNPHGQNPEVRIAECKITENKNLENRNLDKINTEKINRELNRELNSAQQLIPIKISAPKIITRHIPRAVRREVLLRDNYRCSYIAPDGTRCDAKHHLHMDHIKPFSFGGGHNSDNLRVLCGAHNLARK
jgi:5-methylcytosine-specific restriction endonuclease McrA